jgi:NAD(P)H-hydrate repair Nnr-like enzyme with NAD(P)H-hydrate dehydratase domain
MYASIPEFGRYIIDAAAISYFDDEQEVSENLNNIPEYSIITPHVGEFKSFFQLNDISFSSILSIQKKIENTIIILKSFNTFIITKDMIYIMDKGPSLLATSGTGDVLSGILVSLLSQGYSRLEASILGTYLHAEAANYYMNNISKDGMTASDLIDCIPYAFNEIRKEK